MNAIYTLAVGVVEDAALAVAEQCLAKSFSFPIRTLPALNDPAFAYDQHRRQYNSTLIMKELVRYCPPEAVRLLAITERDLFIPMLTFVFGHAQLDGRIALVSLARLRQEFYGLPARQSLFELRLRKEILHEVGHTFGLVHCNNIACPMTLSTAIQSIDRKGNAYCRNCKSLLDEKMVHPIGECSGILRRDNSYEAKLGNTRR